MRAKLGSMCYADIKSAWLDCTTEAVDESMDRPFWVHENKESKAKNETEIEEEAARMAFRGPATKPKYADVATSSQLAADGSGFRCQRRRQRFSNADEPGTVAPTASADAIWPNATVWAPVDAEPSSGGAADACDACDESLTGHYFHWTASYACYAKDTDLRRTADRDEGTAEAEQNSQRVLFTRKSKKTTRSAPAICILR